MQRETVERELRNTIVTFSNGTNQNDHNERRNKDVSNVEQDTTMEKIY